MYKLHAGKGSMKTCAEINKLQVSKPQPPISEGKGEMKLQGAQGCFSHIQLH